jgi:hypothetical protein
MAARVNSIFLALTLSACANAQQLPEIQIQNDLSKCIEIKYPVRYIEELVPIATLEYKSLYSTADCGCKSELSAYSVYTIEDNNDYFLMKGIVLFKESGKVSLPLSTSKVIMGKGPLRINLSCAQPD